MLHHNSSAIIARLKYCFTRRMRRPAQHTGRESLVTHSGDSHCHEDICVLQPLAAGICAGASLFSSVGSASLELPLSLFGFICYFNSSCYFSHIGIDGHVVIGPIGYFSSGLWLLFVIAIHLLFQLLAIAAHWLLPHCSHIATNISVWNIFNHANLPDALSCASMWQTTQLPVARCLKQIKIMSFDVIEEIMKSVNNLLYIRQLPTYGHRVQSFSARLASLKVISSWDRRLVFLRAFQTSSRRLVSLQAELQ